MNRIRFSHLFVVCVVWLGLAYANPSLANPFNPVRQAVKRTLEIIIEKAMGVNGMLGLRWKKEVERIVPRIIEDIDAAGQPLSYLTSTQIQRIYRYLSNPEIAGIVVTDELMLGRPALMSELRAGWQRTLTLFREAGIAQRGISLTDAKGATAYRGDLKSITKNKETFALLERFFYDEISQVVEQVDHRLLYLGSPNDLAFNKSLAELKRLFGAEPSPLGREATAELNTYVRGLLTKVSEKIESLQKWLPSEKHWVSKTVDQGGSLESFKEKLADAGRYFKGLDRYLAELDALQWLLKKYDLFLEANRTLPLVAEETIFMLDDYLRAVLRYSENEQLRQYAIRMIVQKNSLGDGLFSSAVLRDLLAGADHGYRQEVLAQIKNSMKMRRWQLRSDAEGVLETLYEESCRLMRGDPKFNETIERMIALIRYRDEAAMAKVLADPTVLAAHKQGVVEALGRLDTPEAFEVLFKSYFEEGFRHSLATEELLETFTRVLVDTLEGNGERAVILARQQKISGLLHGIYAYERQMAAAAVAEKGVSAALIHSAPGVWRGSIWALGELYWKESHPETVALFRALLADAQAPVEMQVEALLALSKMKLPAEIKGFIRSFLQEGVQPELRAAAAICLPSERSSAVLLSSLSAPPSEISDRLLLEVLEEFHRSRIKDVFKLDHLKKAIAAVMENRSSVEVRIRALSVLSSRQDTQAALTLLNELFDRATVAQKSRIIEMALIDHTSTEVLKRTFDRIFEMYRIQNAEFDIFNILRPALIKKRFLYLIERAPADMAATELLEHVNYTSGEFRDFLSAILAAR